MNLKSGIYTEKRIVQLFGTSAQKQYYKKHKFIKSSYKAALLNTAKRYCDIEQINKKSKRDKREYKITNIYPLILPKAFSYMQKSLYKYIIPLTIDHVLSHQKFKSYTKFEWLNKLCVIDKDMDFFSFSNYCNKHTNIDKKFQYLFLGNTLDTIYYYLSKSFEYIDLFDCFNIKNTLLIKEKNGEYRIATNDEELSYDNCLKMADKILGITNIKERYYSSKSSSFKEQLNNNLKKLGFISFRNTIEISCNNTKQGEFILFKFKFMEDDRAKYISELKELLQYKLLNNALERYNSVNITNLYSNKHVVQEDYKRMCNIFLGTNNLQ